MTLNHLNLTVTDPTETSAFLAKYFGLLPGGGNQGMQMLRDDSGMVLTLIKARQEDARSEGQGAKGNGQSIRYPSSFHIGFIQPSPARVDEINQRLRDDGFDVDAPARLHGSWTFYFQAPGGFTVEVLA
jgi:lactoylglutathione lyase